VPSIKKSKKGEAIAHNDITTAECKQNVT